MESEVAFSLKVVKAPAARGRTRSKPKWGNLFKGEGVEFADWAFVLKSYLACINPQYVGLLERAEQNRSPMPNRALGTADQQLSTKLYYG